MHMEMVLVLLLSLVVCQFVLLFWKNYHLRSYQVGRTGSTSVGRISLCRKVSHHDRHVDHSLRSLGEIRLSAFYRHLDVLHGVRDPTRDASADRTEYAPVEPFGSARPKRRKAFLFFSLVYKWFLLVYKVSYGLAIGGYFLIMMTFLGINNLLLISPQTSLDFGILIMFYGIYYGVLGRDMAESCTERMTSKSGVR